MHAHYTQGRMTGTGTCGKLLQEGGIACSTHRSALLGVKVTWTSAKKHAQRARPQLPGLPGLPGLLSGVRGG